MGAKNSTHHDGHGHNEHPKSSTPPPVETPPVIISYAPPLSPQLRGFASDAALQKHCIIPPAATAYLHSAIPSSFAESDARHPDTWVLLYNSAIHGASFNRMVQLITGRGPTIVVVKDGTSGRIFGGYNEKSWSTIAMRDRESKSTAASNARAVRDGMHNVIVNRPANQAGTFFGNEHSFLFRCDEDSASDGTPVHIYHARPSANSNFMYLFDAHPDDDKVGIGMGGAPGHMGWFINRWLEEGTCRGARCTTYHNPMLSATEQWRVEAVEVYAVGRNMVEELRVQEVAADGKVASDTGDSIRKGADRVVDKIILELGQTHHFYADEDPRCDDDNVTEAKP